jgi:molybdopterin-guanine dinucleotide biosynthesis protein A
MGRDKALLEIGGRPLVLRISEELAKSCASVSIVGDPATYGSLGLPVVADAFPGCGPLAGIEAALAATDAEWNLIAACDMPSIDAGVIETLFAAAADCALPRYPDGRAEPLCSVYRKRCHPAIRRALESGIRKVTDALRLLEDAGFHVAYVPVSDPASFANLNTPDDLRRFLLA